METVEIDKQTNEQEKPSKLRNLMNKIKAIFFVLNIFSLVVYSVYTFYSLYNKNKSSFFSKLLVIVLIVYAVLLIFVIISSFRNKTKLKAELKTYKSTLTILKSVVKILNLSLAVMTAIHIFVSSGKLNIPLIVFGILSIFIAFMSIGLEVLKIIIRKKLQKRKERKLLEKQEKNSVEVE